MGSSDARLDAVYRQVREILAATRDRAWQAVNSAMVTAYWEVGRVIVEEEQAGEERAGYGKRVLEGLSERLGADFGKGFDPSNLRNMRAFYLAYPIRDALRHELSWTHYRLLLRVEDPEARAFYEAEAVSARWSTRELERQIGSLLFQRLALERVMDLLVYASLPAGGWRVVTRSPTSSSAVVQRVSPAMAMVSEPVHNTL